MKMSLLRDLLSTLFGNNQRVLNQIDERGFLFSLSGFTTEASHYAYSLFLISLIFFTSYKLFKKNLIWVFFSVVLMILTMSFSSLLFVISLFVIILVTNNKDKFKVRKKSLRLILTTVGLISFAIFIYNTDFFQSSYFGERLNEVINKVNVFMDFTSVRSISYSSSAVRLISSFSTLSVVANRPLFGVGLGANSSHGSFSTILADIGIIGTLSWLYVLFGNLGKEKARLYNIPYVLCIAVWCALGLFLSRFLGMLHGAENYILPVIFTLLCSKDSESYFDDSLPEKTVAYENRSRIKSIK